MPARDQFHQCVKQALINSGWIITHDPLYLDFDSTRIQIDLAGELLLGAQRGSEKIAVEVKSFLAPSTMYEFHLAIGQCFTYRIALRAQQPERKLYLAIPVFTYEDFFCRSLATETVQEAKLSLIVYEPTLEVILKWID